MRVRERERERERKRLCVCVCVLSVEGSGQKMVFEYALVTLLCIFKAILFYSKIAIMRTHLKSYTSYSVLAITYVRGWERKRRRKRKREKENERKRSSSLVYRSGT